MSRMIFAFYTLTILSGCCSLNEPNRISLVSARLETLGSNHGQLGRPCRSGECCIPPRPFTPGYESWWDDYLTEHTGHRCAFRSLNLYRQQCGRPVSHHFKMGFIAAYEDLAMNRRPSPPIVPPSKYWNAYYRSCAGKPCVDDWFAGYDAGLEMGCNGGVSQFHEIYLRRNGCGDGPANQYDYAQANQIRAAQQPPLQQPSPPPLTPIPAANSYGMQER